MSAGQGMGRRALDAIETITTADAAVETQRTRSTLAIVLNLGHTKEVKSIVFHPKALEFLRGEDQQVRREIGEALRDLQKGLHLAMPLSRPMPDVASGAHELRIRGKASAVRVFYFLKVAESILVFHAFRKKTQKTPQREMALARQRLQEVLHGNV